MGPQQARLDQAVRRDETDETAEKRGKQFCRALPRVWSDVTRDRLPDLGDSPFMKSTHFRYAKRGGGHTYPPRPERPDK